MWIQKQYIINLTNKGKRIDGRGFEDYREISIEKNPIYKAEGSARAKIGDTEVLVGVKMNVGEPYPDKPDEGVLIVSAEFSPLASPRFETGPPREDAIELARVVDRGIRESGAIDTTKLCIKPKEKVWIINLDIHILNHTGNLIDASGLAAIQALMNTKLPEFDGEGVVFGSRTNKKLPIKHKPIPVTLAKLGDVLVVDPDIEEEDVAGTKITVSTNEKGNICAIQKDGTEPLTMKEIEKAFEISIKKGKDLRKLLS